MLKNIYHRIILLKNFIKKFIYYLPVIWKDKDFDSYYTYEILKMKLKRQISYYSKNSPSLNKKSDLKWMKICYTLLDRHQNDYYTDEYFDYYEMNIGFKNRNGSYTMDTKLKWEKYDEYINKYPLVLKKINTHNKSKSDICSEISRINQDRCRNLLFSIMKREMDNWWV